MSSPRRQASYITMHLRAFLQGVGDLARQPIGNLMTILVLAIAILLPALFYFVGINAQAIGKRWHDQPQISLYLKADTSASDAEQLNDSIRKHQLVTQSQYVSPDQGWASLDEMLHLDTMKEQLGGNPLPGVIRVTPNWPGPSPAMLAELTKTLEQSPLVATADLDIGWVKRLAYMLTIGERLLGGLGALFAIAVMLIIANTIRLTIARHHQEICLLRLLGASKSFIIRPFLYRGILFGLFGGALARVAIWGLEHWLEEPIHALSQTYLSQFQLHTLNTPESIILIVGSGLLGLLGARLAAANQLSKSR